MKYLIVGLGNIGPEYHETRHNIGFMVVDALAQEAGATFKDGRYGFTTTLSVKGRQLLLLKPSTYMNLSPAPERKRKRRGPQWPEAHCRHTGHAELRPPALRHR